MSNSPSFRVKYQDIGSGATVVTSSICARTDEEAIRKGRCCAACQLKSRGDLSGPLSGERLLVLTVELEESK